MSEKQTDSISVMEKNYDKMIEARAQEVFNVMAPRVTPEKLTQIREAYDFARLAHEGQKRKTGEPYIIHPIAVAKIAADELMLDANTVIAAFLHDVVEDTDFTLPEIRTAFGDDVAGLVKAVTKPPKTKESGSKQIDNYRQILQSAQYDMRALLLKLADRLHNMRTLSSMRPDKQMKIAGETDYFYAPLANRLGFYMVKTELENLSFRFRCPLEYDELASLTANDEAAQKERLKIFRDQIGTTLAQAGIDVTVITEYRQPYSIWRKMHKYGDDFNHLKYRHFTEIIYETPDGMTEKDMALKIYSVLTNRFKEKPGGISNYIDSPKENGYQSFHVKLLADFGRWQEVHISSSRMVNDSRLGVVAERTENNISHWIEKFRNVLRDMARREDGDNFMDNVTATFYNDDIMTFTPKGKPVILPQKASVLDFAYEIHSELGEHAKYARVNGFLSSIKASLRRGDVVEIFTDPECHPSPDWLDHVVTYKAKDAIRKYLRRLRRPEFNRLSCCNPIPGEEVIGFLEKDCSVTIHKRDCPVAIKLASELGDRIVSVDFKPDDNTLYPVSIVVKAVDRYHLFIDLVDTITNKLHLAITSINTDTEDSIVTCRLSFAVHSYLELRQIMRHISNIESVDEVKRLS